MSVGVRAAVFAGCRSCLPAPAGVPGKEEVTVRFHDSRRMLGLGALVLAGAPLAHSADPLPSWNDTPPKQAILVDAASPISRRKR